MATQKVHGITIDLDVNTKGVDESFKGINKSLKQSKSELTSVNKLLKDDANNVVLLSQKQAILSNSIDSTSKKLKQLQEAKKKADEQDSGVDKNSKQYRELERDIIATKKALEDLRNEQSKNSESFTNAVAGIDLFSEANEKASDSFNKVAIKNSVLSAIITAGIKEVVSAAKEAAQAVGEWANSYRENEVYEKQFENNIRNTADATDEEIDALKKLAAQKSKEGVISKKSITSAYQELATYVESTEAIEGLTDALVDMSAQQYGVDATEESVRNIATTLGKALANGDYSGLTRLGYGFTDAQERIMKWGNEAQRVAVINDVISDSIGGMNEALAETDAGKIFQASQYFNDAKDSVGELVSEIQVNFLDGVMPSVQEFIDGSVEWLQDHKDEIMEMVESVVTWLTSEDVNNFFDEVATLVEHIGEILDYIGKILVDSGALEGAWNILTGIVKGLNEMWDAIVEDVKYIKENGIFSWGMNNYNNTDWSSGSDSWTPGWSGGFGINSGGIGAITLNASFNIQNSNVTNEDLANQMAYQMIDIIDAELGKRM